MYIQWTLLPESFSLHYGISQLLNPDWIQLKRDCVALGEYPSTLH